MDDLLETGGETRPDLRHVVPGLTELIVRHSNGGKQSIVMRCTPAEMRQQIERSRKTGWIRYRNGTLYACLLMQHVSVIGCRCVFDNYGVGKNLVETKIAEPIWDED